jgi:hypothetical protein
VGRRDAEQPGIVLPGGRPPFGKDRVVQLGRHESWPEAVREIQRASVINAFVREVGRRGLSGASVGTACRRAGVPAGVFGELFPRKCDCALTAFSIGSEIVCDLGEVAFRQTGGAWEVRLQAAISTMFDLLTTSPGFARLAIVDVRRDVEGIMPFNAVVARCRASFGSTREPRMPVGLDGTTKVYESVLVGAALGALEAAVHSGRTTRLPELAATVTYALALPTVGPDRATELLPHT